LEILRSAQNDKRSKKTLRIDNIHVIFGTRQTFAIAVSYLIQMSDYSQEGAGKISLHGNGMGVASPEDIEKRAREIAMIDERDPDEFTETDWAQARKELLGAEHPTPPEETKENAELSDDWYVAARSRGHRVPRPGVDEEEETVGEHLVTDGVEDAAHDQMLDARKEELEQEGGIT
jgi:hypothetical protein